MIATKLERLEREQQATILSYRHRPTLLQIWLLATVLSGMAILLMLVAKSLPTAARVASLSPIATTATRAGAVERFQTSFMKAPTGATPTVTCTPNWATVPSSNSQNGTGFLRGVAAISPNDMWAVGYSQITNGQPTLALHWDGSSW